MGGKLSYGRITWANYPNEETPLNNDYLNKIHAEPPKPRKCKCCGAPLTYEDDFIKCEYCGTLYN